jgi:hypothetical protein
MRLLSRSYLGTGAVGGTIIYKADGIRYMLPRPPCTTTSRWDVKGGVYFEGSEPYDIVTLTKDTFAYRSREADHITFTLKRTTKEATQ